MADINHDDWMFPMEEIYGGSSDEIDDIFIDNAYGLAHAYIHKISKRAGIEEYILRIEKVLRS